MFALAARMLKRGRLRLRVRLAGGTLGPRATLRGNAPLIDNQGRLSIGRQLTVIGRPIKVRVSVAPGAELEIGDHVLLNQGVTVFASTRVSIGSHTKLADLVTVYDTDFHEVDEGSGPRRASVTIGSNVWLGRGVMVLPGVSIGDHTVVAAGAVVVNDLPERCLAAGSPARPVRQLVASEGYVRP